MPWLAENWRMFAVLSMVIERPKVTRTRLVNGPSTRYPALLLAGCLTLSACTNADLAREPSSSSSVVKFGSECDPAREQYQTSLDDINELLAEHEEAVQSFVPPEQDDYVNYGDGSLPPALDRSTIRSLGRRVVTAVETFPECFDAAERLEAANIDAALDC